MSQINTCHLKNIEYIKCHLCVFVSPSVQTRLTLQVVYVCTISFSLIWKQRILLVNVNHAHIRFWNQPVQGKGNEGKVSCSRKQRGPLMRFNISSL